MLSVGTVPEALPSPFPLRHRRRRCSGAGGVAPAREKGGVPGRCPQGTPRLHAKAFSHPCARSPSRTAGMPKPANAWLSSLKKPTPSKGRSPCSGAGGCAPCRGEGAAPLPRGVCPTEGTAPRVASLAENVGSTPNPASQTFPGQQCPASVQKAKCSVENPPGAVPTVVPKDIQGPPGPIPSRPPKRNPAALPRGRGDKVKGVGLSRGRRPRRPSRSHPASSPRGCRRRWSWCPW